MYLSYPQAPIGFLSRYKWAAFSWRLYGAEVQPPLAWCGQPRTSRSHHHPDDRRAQGKSNCSQYRRHVDSSAYAAQFAQGWSEGMMNWPVFVHAGIDSRETVTDNLDRTTSDKCWYVFADRQQQTT